MTNLVLITREDTPERYQLAAQALSSILASSRPDQFTLTIVTDGSSRSRLSFQHPSNISELIVLPVSSILGQLRNLGAWWSQAKFGRGEYLCFLDNDIAITDPEWLQKMIYMNRWPDVLPGVVGGCQHPFHGTNQIRQREFVSDVSNDFVNRKIVGSIELHEVDAVAGYSMFMTWNTWDKCGPFDANAPGTGQSEDFALCQRVKAGGGIVGYVDPSVLSHCGITDSNGNPAVGADLFPRVPGLLYL